MKIFSITVAALVGLAESKKTISSSTIKKQLREGRYDKKKLFANAKPYDHPRTLNEDSQQVYAADQEESNVAFELTGAYSVDFNACGSLTMQNENLFSENYINYSKHGWIVSQKNYILFDVSLTNAGENTIGVTYITDIASFLSAFVDYLPDMVKNYCSGCLENNDYCYSVLNIADYSSEAQDQDVQEQEQAQDEAGQQDGGNRRRQLRKYLHAAKSQRQTRTLVENVEYELINCQQCLQYDCFDNDENQQDGDISTWLQELAGCNKLDDVTLNNLPVYAGFTCNSYGTGIEVGMFVDEECTMQTNQLGYASTLVDEDDLQYYSILNDVVEFMFDRSMSCSANVVRYYNPIDGYNTATEVPTTEVPATELPGTEVPGTEVPTTVVPTTLVPATEVPSTATTAQLSEYCYNLFNVDQEPLSLSDCGGNSDESNLENESNNDEEVYDPNVDTYLWYSYQITQSQASDATELCRLVASWLQTGGSVSSSTYNSGDTDSSVWDEYSPSTSYSLFFNTSEGQLSREAQIGIIVGVILVLGTIVGAIVFKLMEKMTKKNPKSAPLISSEVMAA